MTRSLTLTLIIALMMFPQTSETIYSPALPYISISFNVLASEATTTISIYFVAFAIGIVFWGYACDVIGRRPVILYGLLIYFISCFIALFTTTFWMLIIARILAAFGAAVGSIGIQTILRDNYQSHELSHIFSKAGIALSMSPAIGLLIGSLLIKSNYYQMNFIGLTTLSFSLFLWCFIRLPETKKEKKIPNSIILKMVKLMIRDIEIWRSAVLISLLNIFIFSFFQQGPFLLEKQKIPVFIFGYYSFILAFGALLGSLLSKKLNNQIKKIEYIKKYTNLFLCIGTLLMMLLEPTPWFPFAQFFIVFAYSLAIPSLLGESLKNYRQYPGTAGAFLGLLYYSLLAIGLFLSSMNIQLKFTFIISTILFIFFSKNPKNH